MKHSSYKKLIGKININIRLLERKKIRYFIFYDREMDLVGHRK